MTDVLATVSQVKQFLRLPPETVADDALIQRLVMGVSVAFTNELNLNILLADYTEVRDGPGGNTLVLLNKPVVAVSSVAVGAPNITRRTLVADRDYVFTKTAIKLLCGVFARGVANVAVSYSAGYATVPWDLAEKCAKVTAQRYRELERLGQTSKVLAGETVNFDTKDFPSDVTSVLDNYRRVAPL